jgi:hypothetical protein
MEFSVNLGKFPSSKKASFTTLLESAAPEAL